MKNILLTLLKYASLPLALLYGFVVALRNKFYDSGFFTSIEFSLPVICVGNITVGGTGKSPHIEYLIELLQNQYQIATLSRGYKRYTRGFRIADANSNARDIGDEPFQFKAKYPNVEVCVAEERMTAIPQLLQKKPHVEIILLDDAFQHRTVKAGLNILLTDYHRLYTRDYIMPFGLLRESKSAAKRAQVIIVSKCPHDLSIQQRDELISEIAPLPEQQIFFSTIAYKTIYPLSPNQIQLETSTTVLLVCGIANPEPLKLQLEKSFSKVYTLTYPDHHYFTTDDIAEIHETFNNITTSKKIIVCTEKDAAKLILQQEVISKYELPIFIQPIGIEFLFDGASKFNEICLQYIQSIIPVVSDVVLYDEEQIEYTIIE